MDHGKETCPIRKEQYVREYVQRRYHLSVWFEKQRCNVESETSVGHTDKLDRYHLPPDIVFVFTIDVQMLAAG